MSAMGCEVKSVRAGVAVSEVLPLSWHRDSGAFFSIPLAFAPLLSLSMRRTHRLSAHLDAPDFATAIENPGSRGAPSPTGKPGQANDYGMLFELESNGCQIMPSMAMPDPKSAVS